MSCVRNFCPQVVNLDSSPMKFEDFVSEDALFADPKARAIPKEHLLAVSATAVIAGCLFFILPDESRNAAHDAPYLGGTAYAQVLHGELTLDDRGLYVDNQDESKTVLTPNQSSSAFLTAAAPSAPAGANDTALKDEDDQGILDGIINPTAKLTDTLAKITQAEAVSNTETMLDNFDDGMPDAMLADSDSGLRAELDALTGTRAPAKWYVESIQRGDTISSVFSDFNIPWEVMEAVTKHQDAGNSLASLRPGNSLSFLMDDKNNLFAFVKQISATEQIRFFRQNPTDKFSVVRESLNAHLVLGGDVVEGNEKELAATAVAAGDDAPQYTKRGRLVVVTVNKGESFSKAAYSSGLTYSEIAKITKLFSGRIQFSRHIQPGDTMRVLFSDEKGKGKINAVEFKLKKHGTITTYRNAADDEYYDENGYNVLTAAFRRFPLDGKVRISSHFNPQRRHPVTGVIRPHKGTDFAVPVGTPVVAPADGIVDKASYSRSSGYYVVLRHAGGYSTVYMHLSKINVNVGQKVKIGSTIARSGNTGLSTGPHLHYELRLNNRPVNAMRVNLPKNGEVAVASKQRKRFDSNVAVYKKELHEDSLIAMTGS